MDAINRIRKEVRYCRLQDDKSSLTLILYFLVLYRLRKVEKLRNYIT